MTTEEILSDDVEGIDDDESTSLGNYPIDTFLIRTETRTVHDILRRIDKGSFVMDPDFQRDFIWPDDKQSKLIESVLMRIPLPVFYLAEDDKGRMIVVDGLQRLSTFGRFVKNELKLKFPKPKNSKRDEIEGTKLNEQSIKQSEFEGKTFKDLSPKFQNRIEDCNLTLYIIDAKVPERARLDIFERVNGGIALTRQQMRNCLYNGKATRFIKDKASTELFKTATGSALKTQTMRDREFVNRFCAFQLLPIEKYKDDMDEWLAMALKKMNGLDEAALEKLSTEFNNSLNNNYFLFGDHAFRKHNQGQEKRSVINASLWDVMITGLAKYSHEQVITHAERFKEYFYSLIKCEKFIWSITYGPNSTDRVRYRFEETQKMFAEVFDDHIH